MNDKQAKEWRTKHAGDRCVCKHPRIRHYTPAGAQSNCHRCGCQHFQKSAS